MTSPSTPTPLRAFLESRLPATLDLLREFVTINSHTANREGVNRLGRLTAERFAPLGFSAEHVPHEDPALGDHLVLRRPGRTQRVIALISHLDTVFPEEEEARNNFRWLPEGDRIYGPGTIDIKGGTAMMHLVLTALAQLDPEAFESAHWLLLWNASEEILTRDFREICRDRLDPEQTLAALVFECEGRPRGVPALVVGRKGRATFRITVEGRAAHAGGKHARGANAITQIARVIDRVSTLTDYSRDLTLNVGTVQAGLALNRVPHLATAQGEVRAFDAEVLRGAIQALLAFNGPGDVQSAADGYRCHVTVEVPSEVPAWPRNAGTDRLFELWKGAAQDLNYPLEPECRGGLSDGNWISGLVPTLDGLGPHGDNDHCSERSADGSKLPEYISVPSLVPKADLNVRALQRLLAVT